MEITMTKQQIIEWLEGQIWNAERGDTVARPCVEGMRLAVKCLKEEPVAATTTEVKAVSKGEIDAIIERLEISQKKFNISERYDDVQKLLDYVKTAALLPKEVSNGALQAMWATTPAFIEGGRSLDWKYESRFRHHKTGREVLTERYNALYNHLTTPPKPKMKKVWYTAWRAPYSGDIIQRWNNEEECKKNHAAAIEQGFTNVSPIWEQEVEDKS